MPLTPAVLWNPYQDDFLPGVESYVTLQKADTLMVRSLQSESWGATPAPILDDPDDPYYAEPFAPPPGFVALVETKKAALRDASQVITALPLLGQKTLDELPLAFPRHGLRDANGDAVSSTTIPEQVERATAFLAVALLKARRDGTADTANLLVSSRVGQSASVFRKPKLDDLPRQVRKLLEPFLKGGASWAPVRA